jgi:glycosyltransferase involved in cell wall biosynthesis
MNPGGVETWLMDLLRAIDHRRVAFDFLVHVQAPAVYDDEIRALGSRVIACPEPQTPIAYGRRLGRLLNTWGPYDAVHSHVHHFSGRVLRVARRLGVPVRVAHSHSDTRLPDRTVSVARALYLRLMGRWIRRYATAGLAASQNAAAALWGPNWESDGRWRVFHCGIDVNRFRAGADRERARAELGIPPGCVVVGHVGSFGGVKNHSFLIRMAREMMSSNDRVWLLLVGEGAGRREAEEQVRRLGIGRRVVFAGLRSDVPRLMKSAMDVFVFPSLYEGLPLAVVEAQAAGLPVVISDSVTREVAVAAGLVTWRSLSDSISSWVSATCAASVTPVAIRESALAQVERSTFNIRTGIERLEELYGLDGASTEGS